MKKYYGIIVVALTIVLGIGISYALFSQTLNISGTAATSGEFSVVFDNTATALNTQVGSTGASITVAGDKKSASVSVPALEYPGAYAEFTVQVENEGSIDAILNSITPVGLTTDPNIEVTFVNDTTPLDLDAGDTNTFTLKVSWKSTSSSYTEEPISFSIALDYEQAA